MIVRYPSPEVKRIRRLQWRRIFVIFPRQVSDTESVFLGHVYVRDVFVQFAGQEKRALLYPSHCHRQYRKSTSHPWFPAFPNCMIK